MANISVSRGNTSETSTGTKVGDTETSRQGWWVLGSTNLRWIGSTSRVNRWRGVLEIPKDRRVVWDRGWRKFRFSWNRNKTFESSGENCNWWETEPMEYVKLNCFKKPKEQNKTKIHCWYTGRLTTFDYKLIFYHLRLNQRDTNFLENFYHPTLAGLPSWRIPTWSTSPDPTSVLKHSLLPRVPTTPRVLTSVVDPPTHFISLHPTIPPYPLVCDREDDRVKKSSP